jgi:arabinan endo-1,5-alpha-L-arabinosidase
MRPATWHHLTALTSGPLVLVAILVAVSWDQVSASDTTPTTESTRPRANDRLADDQVGSAGDAADEAARLLEADAADPFVIVDNGQPWLFTTNNGAGNVPAVSKDSTGHLVVSDALPVLPAWAVPGYTWAPAVTYIGDQWVLAFTANHEASGRQCIGVATSPTIGGPYTPAPDPLMCDLGKGGSIDPSFVIDDTGAYWLLYKDDGNCCGLPTTLHSVLLTGDGTQLAGSPATLVTADQPWEEGLVEAPTMRRVGDRWLLLYSANTWDSANYAVGAAWCETPSGPCHKQPEPALTNGPGIDGPGGVEFISASTIDTLAVAFHAWPEGSVGYRDGSTRRLRLGRVTVTGDTVTITPARPPNTNQAPKRS